MDKEKTAHGAVFCVSFETAGLVSPDDFNQIFDPAVERDAHFQKQRAVIADDFVLLIFIYNRIFDIRALA